jgi:phosphomannomutase
MYNVTIRCNTEKYARSAGIMITATTAVAGRNGMVIMAMTGDAMSMAETEAAIVAIMAMDAAMETTNIQREQLAPFFVFRDTISS